MQNLRHASSRMRRAIASLAACAALPLAGASHATALNDTGQQGCYSSSGTAEPCSAEPEDGRYGRDAAAAAGALSKTGAGVAAFDFTKIANSGAALPATAALGSNPGDWACTRDNVTGLVWEIKTEPSGDLRYLGHAYTWYSTGSDNGGGSGGLGTNTCNGTLAAYGNHCNTQNYVLAINAVHLCGYTDWRLPTVGELESIVHFGTGNDPTIDTDYFPNTIGGFYWTGTPYSLLPDTDAWAVDFAGGQGGNQSNNGVDKTAGIWVRLVRGTP